MEQANHRAVAPWQHQQVIRQLGQTVIGSMKAKSEQLMITQAMTAKARITKAMITKDV